MQTLTPATVLDRERRALQRGLPTATRLTTMRHPNPEICQFSTVPVPGVGAGLQLG